MKSDRFIILLAISLLLVFSCGESYDLISEPSGDTGSADFSMYVALGNSLTAGVQSGVIKEDFQRYSYPNLIAGQAGISSFEQPLVSHPGLGTGLMELTSISPLTLETSNPTGVPQNVALARPYNNLGIPGITSYDLYNAINATTNFAYLNTGTGDNPLIDLILRNTSADPAVALTCVKAALALNPTFITIWIGNNDALAAAVYGSTANLIPSAVLQGNLAITITDITGTAKIVLANIPDVTTIPFVNTYPPYILDPDTGELLIVNGSPVLYVGAQPTDKILLTAKDYIAAGYGLPASLPGGTGLPLPDGVVLTSSEIAAISAHVDDLNDIIDAIAAQNNIPVVDMNSIFNDIYINGFHYAGQTYTAEFITGGLFSLDGIHPTSKGYGIVANEFIKVINNSYGADIPLVDINELPGIPLPSLGKGSLKDINIFSLIDSEAFKNVRKLFGN